MKLLRITASGLPLFKDELDLIFYAKKRVSEDDRETLFCLKPLSNIYLNPATALIGINASGKTSILRVIQLALSIVKNEPINHSEGRTILGGTNHAVFRIYFYDMAYNVCCLETEIAARKTLLSEYHYIIVHEKLWEKSTADIQSKAKLTDFSDQDPVSTRDGNDIFLPDDVSFIIAHNKRNNESCAVCSLSSYTNVNMLPIFTDIPLDVISFLDPTVENLSLEKIDERNFVRLKFKGKHEIILNRTEELEQYLSSGTIKGILTFSLARGILQSGGYFLIDEIENHFNKEIVRTLIRFFMDSALNKNGGVLIFTTHYAELLDLYNRNDSIYIVTNKGGITAQNASTLLNRNDIKKSDAYQSGYLGETVPSYETYMKLRKSFDVSIQSGVIG